MKPIYFYCSTKTLLACIILGIVINGIIGCSTTQQTTTYNALATIEGTADTAYSNYVHLVITGTVGSGSFVSISKALNDLHAAIGVAATLDQSGTNVLVGTNVTAELTAFTTAVATAIANK
jgi:hypothetical protein